MLAVVFALAAAACASGPPKPIKADEMKDPGLGMIYGQIQLPDPEWRMNVVMIKIIGKAYVGRHGEKVHVARDGRFVAVNVKPGKYMMDGFIIGDMRNYLGKSALNYTVEVKPGGVHYIGSYRYVSLKGGSIVRPGSFDLEQNQSKAAHTALLAWVEEATRETKWHSAVKRKLGGLNK
ncbi:MAG: hypothetical protein A2010_11675 [Nitrospirae bacterium GWD2_57_9]|nr:MAG: hypothetical protein A2010_11675 [Nitrospirae bacterium GWD2_57_9]